MKTFKIKKDFFLTRKLAKCLISFTTVFIVCEFNYLLNIKKLYLVDFIFSYGCRSFFLYSKTLSLVIWKV